MSVLKTTSVLLLVLLCAGCVDHGRDVTWRPAKGDRVADVRGRLTELNYPFEESVLYGGSRGDLIFKVRDTKYRCTYLLSQMVIESEPVVYNPLLGRETYMHKARKR